MKLTPTIISVGQMVLDMVVHEHPTDFSLSGDYQLPKKFTIGGPPAFCAITGLQLSRLFSWFFPPLIYAYSCQKAMTLLQHYPGIEPLLTNLRLHPLCPQFRLEYHRHGSERRLYLKNPPKRFDPTDFPWNFDIPPIAVIGSVYNEFNAEKIFTFLRKKTAFIAFDLQGCFRRLTSQGRVIFQKWAMPEILRHIDCLKISEIEAKHLGGEDDPLQVLIQTLKTPVRIVLLTQGSKGSLLGFKTLDNEKIALYSIPAYSTKHVKDETGAGDVFLYAFVVHYVTHHNALEAVAFATSVSSLLIEKKGVAGNFTKEEILTRQRHVRLRVDPVSFPL